MYVPYRRAPSAHVVFFSTPREARLATEIRRLRHSAAAHVEAAPDMVLLGGDPLVEHLASAAGFHVNDLAIMRVFARRSTVTVICVPTRIWRNADDMRSLLGIKAEAEALHSRCILVPQRWIRAPNRSSFARAISAARNVAYSATDCSAVIAFLKNKGSGTVEDCAATLTRHDDPYGAVLAMCAAGLVKLDRSVKLGPGTLVRALI